MFKETFKYYKSKCPPPDYSSVIDFDKIDPEQTVERPIVKRIADDEFRIRGLVPAVEWKVYELKNRPGLIFIKNPFTKRGQRYWIARCLRDYPKAPHAVNLNKKYFSRDAIDDWWTILQNAKVNATDGEQLRLKNGMRWATLGYHHDWDTKVYHEDKRNDFPADLGGLSAFLSEILGFGEYSAEAAIVNFYPLGTTLAGHTDHSEKNLNAPLFSTSFGQTAIFLIGGPTKEEKPVAIFLKSGDIAVMSKESRLSYHAVPKILKTDIGWLNEPFENTNTCCASDTTDNASDTGALVTKRRRLASEYCDSFAENIWDFVIDQTQWQPYAEYICDCRININVRQVLDRGEQTL